MVGGLSSEDYAWANSGLSRLGLSAADWIGD